MLNHWLIRVKDGKNFNITQPALEILASACANLITELRSLKK